MNTDVVEDLKDFIDLKINNSARILRDELGQVIDNSAREIKGELRQEIQKSGSEIMTAIGEVLDTINTTREEQFADHEKRITKLERRTKHFKRPAAA
jgi:hypothetical protein